MTPPNKPQDRDILAAAGAGNGSNMTYVIKNRLQSAGFSVQTPWILRQMKRLERAGEVERVSSPYLKQICWKPTLKETGNG